MCVTSHLWPYAAPLTVIITVGTSGVTDQSAAFDPHPDVDSVYKDQTSATDGRHFNPRPGQLNHLAINLSATN